MALKRVRDEALQRLDARIVSVRLKVLLHPARSWTGRALTGAPGRGGEVAADAVHVLGLKDGLEDQSHAGMLLRMTCIWSRFRPRF